MSVTLTPCQRRCSQDASREFKLCGVIPEALRRRVEQGSPRMTTGARETQVNSSPAVAANAEGEEIEVLESTDILPAAAEDVSSRVTIGHFPIKLFSTLIWASMSRKLQLGD